MMTSKVTIPKWWTSKLPRWVQLLNLLVDLDQILYGGDGNEGDFDATYFNLIASTIRKWQTFKFLRCIQLLNQFMDLDEILY